MSEMKGSTSKRKRVPLKSLALISSVAAGVQFGWALQLSLLTPYVQELGIPHRWASYIWLCGPISGMIVQPLIGYFSDRCESRFGRRRPFIVLGALLVIVAVLLISFSADIGYLIGDSLSSRPRAITIFVVGFWMLDLANNTLQGPCRALLADCTGKNMRRTRIANAFFSFFMAVGNVLGFAAGSLSSWHSIFPFTETTACGVSCANLKSAFLVGSVFLFVTTIISMMAAREEPTWSPSNQVTAEQVTLETRLLAGEHVPSTDSSVEKDGTEKTKDEDEDDMEAEQEVREAFFWELFDAFRDLPSRMWYVLLVMALTWVAWFPFTLYDTDWMGRDMYGGSPTTGEDSSTTILYNKGVRMGSFGLMFQSVVLGLFSLCIERLCRKVGASFVWAANNVIIAACFAGIVILTKVTPHPPTSGGLAIALVIFAVLGAPLAVTYSVPYALTASLTSSTGGGQGLSMGILNLAVVVPQIVISVGAGPFDHLFGGGNLPAFVLGSASALIGAVLAVLLLPRPPPEFRTTGIMRTRSCPI
ncbi:hypothetical protein KP509_22G062900 [Ceratopteris richardii]|uniref:Uncharacterized protein n=1 Tax=Ceratopteris richardii TaxID=49495 RepID=A0A8T2S7R7_CERRI|nr:hypothetical protein KP509_22G062900 [Ceratopteris richardii]